jgi:hypothetical protein
MRNTQWALVAATVAAIVASGNAGAQSPIEQARSMHQEILVNRGDFPHRRLTSGSRIISNSKTTSSGEGTNAEGKMTAGPDSDSLMHPGAAVHPA